MTRTMFLVVSLLASLTISGALESFGDLHVDEVAPTISGDSSQDEDLPSQEPEHVEEMVDKRGCGPDEGSCSDDMEQDTSDHVVPLGTTGDHNELSGTNDESVTPTEVGGGEGEGGREKEGEGGRQEEGEESEGIVVTELPNTALDPPTEPPPATPITTPELSVAPSVATDQPMPSDTHEAIQEPVYETTATEAVPPVEGEGEEEGGDDVPTFTEFSQRKRMEQDSTQKPTPDKPVVATGGKNNYASLDCGAKIVAFNPEGQNAAAILSENRDVYMINPCSAAIWVIVELCELVELHSLQIACFELFSSIPKSFNVSVSERYPSDEWRFLGTMIASNEREVQSFPLAADESSYAKYVRVAMISHYGSEHYCPLSLLRVIGASMMEVYEYSESQQELQIEPSSPTVAPNYEGGEETMEDELFAGVLEENMSQGIIGRDRATSLPGLLAGAIMSVLEMVNDYISPPEELTPHTLHTLTSPQDTSTPTNERSESVADSHQISCEDGNCDGDASETDSSDNADSDGGDSELTRDSDVTHRTETSDLYGTATVSTLSEIHSTTSGNEVTVQSPVHTDSNVHSTTFVPSSDDIIYSISETTSVTITPTPSPPPPSLLPDRDSDHVLEMVSEMTDHQPASGGVVPDGSGVVDTTVNVGDTVDVDGSVLVDVTRTVVDVASTVVDVASPVVSVASPVVSVGDTVVDDPELDEDIEGSGDAVIHQLLEEEMIGGTDNTEFDSKSEEGEIAVDGREDSSDGDSGIPLVAAESADCVEGCEGEGRTVVALVEGEAGEVGGHNRPHSDRSGPESTKDDQRDDDVAIETPQSSVMSPPGDGSDMGASENGERGGNGEVSEGVRSEDGEEVTTEISEEGNAVVGEDTTGGPEGERSHEALNEGLTNGNGAGMLSGQQKEKSVFLRLSNRIRDLEENMSLFSSYLDEISTGMKRNKNRTEDSQRSMEKRLNSLNDSVQVLTNQTGLAMAVLAELFEEMQEVRKTVDSMAEELHQSRREMLQYCVVVTTILVAMALAFPLWLLCNRTASTISHDSHVTQGLTNKTVEYGVSGGHVTGSDSHVTSKEPPLHNGISKAHHISNDRTLPEAIPRPHKQELVSDFSLHSEPWSRVVRRRKKIPKTL